MANKLACRHMQMGRTEDLEAAISNDEQALKKAIDHPDLPRILANLAYRLGRLYQRTATSDAGITTTKEAVNKTPQGHEDLLFNLDNLGVVLERRYDRLGGIEDFDAAIEISKLLVRQVSRDHPNISNFLSGL